MAHRVLSLHASYEIGGDVVDGYVARPATPVPHPGLVVISGMGELNWFQREITRAFACGGFVAVAPDLFDGALPQDWGTQLPYKNSLDVDRTVAHLVGSADFLHSLPWMAVAVGASDADAEE